MNIIIQTILDFTATHYDHKSFTHPLEQLRYYAEEVCPDKDFFTTDNRSNWPFLVNAFKHWLLINEHVIFCTACEGKIKVTEDSTCQYCPSACGILIEGAIEFIKMLRNQAAVVCPNCWSSVDVKGLVSTCPTCHKDCNGLFTFALIYTNGR